MKTTASTQVDADTKLALDALVSLVPTIDDDVIGRQS
jgi:hypothetical protein